MTITREDPRFWDIRTLERRVRRGHLTRKDYEKYLKTIPDSADKSAPVSLDSEPDEPRESLTLDGE